MANFFRLLLALSFFPLVYAFGETLADSVCRARDVSSLDATSLLSFFAGIAVFLVVWHFSPPVKTYVLGHELTHALVALLFGARVSNLRVAASGGSVNVSKTNMMITLSPYFFPFYTVVLMVFALVAGIFVPVLPWKPAWFFLAGFTWFFHICFTLDSIARKQPDIIEYGRVFSYTMIWFFNVGCVLAALVALTELNFPFVAETLAKNSVKAYRAVYEFVSSLSFLQA